MFRCVTLSGGLGRPASLTDEMTSSGVSGLPGHEMALLWGADAQPVLGATAEGSTSTVRHLFPAPGGTRFYLQTLPAGYGIDPERADDMDLASVVPVVSESGGVTVTMFMASGYHYTDTVDCGVIISGSIWLIGPRGEERELRAGDAFVDMGAPHAWENRSDQPCTFALFFVGAERPAAEVGSGPVVPPAEASRADSPYGTRADADRV